MNFAEIKSIAKLCFMLFSGGPIFISNNFQDNSDYTKYGSVYNISIYVVSIPSDLVVMWFRLGNPDSNTDIIQLKQSDKYDIMKTPGVVTANIHGTDVDLEVMIVTLTINSIQPDDLMTYDVRVSNSYGMSQRFIQLSPCE